MSNPYEGQDPLVIAQQAERDLNSHQAKHGDYNKSSSGTTSPPPHPKSMQKKTLTDAFLALAVESGVDEGVTSKFPQSTVKTGSQASGAGDNREIPVDEGGDLISKPGEKGGSGQYVLPRRLLWECASECPLTGFWVVPPRHEILRAPVGRRRSSSCTRRRIRGTTMSWGMSGRELRRAGHRASHGEIRGSREHKGI